MPSKAEIKKMRDEFKKTGELPPHLKKMANDLKKFKVKHKVKDIVVPGMEWMSKLGEERDYHKKAKGIFSKLKDRFTKKKKEEPKKQSKSDSDFYKRQFAGEEKIREYIRSEIKNGNITSKSLDETNKQTLLNIAKMMKGTNESVTEHTVTFTKDDMEKLHSSGEVIKADPDGKEHTYVYKEYVKV